MRVWKKLLCAGILGGSLMIGNMTEAGVVTDRLPLNCYADHKIITYNSPGAKSAGYISANVDLIQITQVRGDGWCYGSYPGAGGRRVSRWFKITDVCADAGYTNRSANVRGKQTVYRTRNGGATIGSVSNNEGVIVVADNGNRAQIVYRLDNGTGYKLGWIPSSSVVSSTPTPTQGHNPRGAFETYGTMNNALRVIGWAKDDDDLNHKVRVHVYIGGTAGDSNAYSKEIVANKNSNACPGHGFDETIFSIPDKYCGRQTVRLYALNDVGAGSFQEIGSKIIDIPSTNPKPVVQEQAGYIKTSGSRLLFRAAPSTSSNILARLNNQTTVIVLAHNIPNGWSKIRYNGREGYVASQYVVIGTPTVVHVDNKLENLINQWKGRKWDNRESSTIGSTCFGFANYIFRELHGVIAGSQLNWSKAYALKNPSSKVSCTYSGYVSENAWHTLLQQCKSGDFLQTTNSSGEKQHSMIFVSYNPNTRTVRILDANFATPPDNIVRDRSKKLSDFAKRFQYVSRYTM